MHFTNLEFRLLISVRKAKALVLRTRTINAQRYLARKKASQLQEFNNLAKNFKTLYVLLSAHPYEKFVTPLWHDFNERAEKAFLPSPSFSFLNDGTIMLTMFGGSSYREELSYLEKKYKRIDLSHLLQEEYVGNPLLVDNRYVTSFNSIRQLYLLALFFEKANVPVGNIYTVVEWGGGYGNMAKLFLRMSSKPVTYIMTDTPLFCCLQWLYLATVLGSKNVHMISSTEDKIQRRKVNIIPIGLLDSFARQIRADLFISTWGLSESSKYSQDFIAKHKWFGAEHILLGYQKSSQDLPYAEYVGELAKKRGANVEVLPILPNNFFAYL